MDWIKAATICACTVVVSIAGCSATINYQDDQAVVQMVRAGAEPIRAMCAVGRTDQTGSVCIVAASR